MKNLLILVLFFQVFAFSQENSTIKNNSPKKKIYVDASFGLGMRLGKTPEGLNVFEEQMINSLKRGLALDLGIYHRLQPESNHFIGIKYNVFLKSAGYNNANVIAPNGETGIGEFSSDTKISYYGLNYLYSQTDKSNSDFNAEVGLGYIHYQDNAVYIKNYNISGGNIGIYTSLSYFLKITNSLYIGPRINFTLGSIKEFKIKGPNNFNETVTLDDNSRESVNKLDLGIGIRIKP